MKKQTVKIMNQQEVENSNADIRMEVWRDEDTESPREWDNIFTLWTGNSRYLSNDKGAHDPRTEAGTKLEEAKYEKGLFVLPLYAYVHGIMRVSLAPFSCPFDSGVIGFLYCDKEKFKEEYGLKRFNAKRALRIAKIEVSELNDFLNGDVFGFTIERKNENGEWEEEDSCGGFYGLSEMVEEQFEKGMAVWTKSPEGFPGKIEIRA